MEPRGEFAATLRALGEEREAEIEHHPETLQLARYARGELPESEEDLLQEHLAACRECASLVLDASFLADESAEPETGEVIEADWADLSRRLGWPSGSGRVWETPTSPGRRFRWAPARLLAACAALAFGAAVLWGLAQRAEVERLRAPQPNVPILEAEDPEATRGAAQPALEVALTRDSPRALLRLFPRVRGPAQGHSARILDEPGRVVWERPGLVPDRYGSFTVELTRAFLPAGRYVVEVRGHDGDETRLVGRYPVEIVDR